MTKVMVLHAKMKFTTPKLTNRDGYIQCLVAASAQSICP